MIPPRAAQAAPAATAQPSDTSSGSSGEATAASGATVPPPPPRAAASLAEINSLCEHLTLQDAVDGVPVDMSTALQMSARVDRWNRRLGRDALLGGPAGLTVPLTSAIRGADDDAADIIPGVTDAISDIATLGTASFLVHRAQAEVQMRVFRLIRDTVCNDADIAAYWLRTTCSLVDGPTEEGEQAHVGTFGESLHRAVARDIELLPEHAEEFLLVQLQSPGGGAVLGRPEVLALLMATSIAGAMLDSGDPLDALTALDRTLDRALGSRSAVQSLASSMCEPERDSGSCVSINQDRLAQRLILLNLGDAVSLARRIALFVRGAGPDISETELAMAMDVAEASLPSGPGNGQRGRRAVRAVVENLAGAYRALEQLGDQSLALETRSSNVIPLISSVIGALRNAVSLFDQTMFAEGSLAAAGVDVTIPGECVRRAGPALAGITAAEDARALAPHVGALATACTQTAGPAADGTLAGHLRSSYRGVIDEVQRLNDAPPSDFAAFRARARAVALDVGSIRVAGEWLGGVRGDRGVFRALEQSGRVQIEAIFDAIDGLASTFDGLARGDFPRALASFVGIWGAVLPALQPEGASRTGGAIAFGVPAEALRLMSITAELLNSRTADEFEAALDVLAAPIGSSARRSEEFTLSLAGLVGLSGGVLYRSESALAPAGSEAFGGGILSLGMDLSWPVAGQAYVGVFVNVLDLGAAVAFGPEQLVSSDALVRREDVAMERVLAPGAFIHAGVAAIDFLTLGVGFTVSPFGGSLHRPCEAADMCGDGQTDVSAQVVEVRTVVFVAVDVPILFFD